MNHPWPAVAMIMQVQMMVVITAVTTIATVEEAIPVMRTSPHQITIIMIMPGVIIVVTIPVVITMEHLHQQVMVEHLHQQMEHLHQQVMVEHLHQQTNCIWHI
jgi:hypothetical protein